MGEEPLTGYQPGGRTVGDVPDTWGECGGMAGELTLLLGEDGAAPTVWRR